MNEQTCALKMSICTYAIQKEQHRRGHCIFNLITPYPGILYSVDRHVTNEVTVITVPSKLFRVWPKDNSLVRLTEILPVISTAQWMPHVHVDLNELITMKSALLLGRYIIGFTCFA